MAERGTTQSVDYCQLAARLVTRACVFMGVFISQADDVVLEANGKSPKDFAYDTVALYLEKNPSVMGGESGVLAYLTRAMKRDILDALRSAPVKKTFNVEVTARSGKSEPGDGLGAKGLDEFPGHDNVAETVEASIFKNRLYALLEKDEPELYDVVYAVFEEGARTPKQIADVVGATPKEINNRQKRLRRFIAKHKVMAVPAGKAE